MDFTLTEAQGELAGLTRRILADKVTPESLGPHGSGGFDRALWTDLAKAGVLDAALPNAIGGGGFGLLEQCSVLTELGRAVAPVPYLPTITVACAALAEFGTPEQRERWAVPALRGDRVLVPVLPDAGDPPGITAEPADGGWVLSGSQTAVPFAAFADGFLISTGSSVFLLDGNQDGVTVSAQRAVDHADAGLVELSGVRVAADAELADSQVPGWLYLRAVTGLCAHQLGVLERALELTAEYARRREQFGHAIGAFQAVRQRLADAYLEVEGVRLTLWQAAWRLAEGLPAAEQVAVAKCWTAQAGHRVAHTAVHVHGGVGIDVDALPHRYFVTAKRNEFALGGETPHLRTLGEILADR